MKYITAKNDTPIDGTVQFYDHKHRLVKVITKGSGVRRNGRLYPVIIEIHDPTKNAVGVRSIHSITELLIEKPREFRNVYWDGQTTTVGAHVYLSKVKARSCGRRGRKAGEWFAVVEMDKAGVVS